MKNEDSGTGERVALGLIVAFHGDANGAPAILESLARQTIEPPDVNVVFARVGSEGPASRAVAEWLEVNPQFGRLLPDASSTLADARDAAMTVTSAHWVAFPRGDDRLEPNLLATVAHLVSAAATAETFAISCRIGFANSAHVATRIDEADRELASRVTVDDRFDQMFSDIARSRDLTADTECVPASARCTFLPVAQIRRLRLRFIDDGEAPEGDDHVSETLFVARLLAATRRPAIVYASDALLSAPYEPMVGSGECVDRATAFMNGFERILERRAQGVGVPEWMATFFLFHITGVFVRELAPRTRASQLTASQQETFLGLVGRSLSHFNPSWVLAYRAAPLKLEIRTLLYSLCSSDTNIDTEMCIVPDLGVRVADFDARRNLMLVRYFHTGRHPREAFRVAGAETAPYASKTRSVPYFGQKRLVERIVWIAGDPGVLEVSLDEARQEIHLGSRPSRFSPSFASVRKRFVHPSKPFTLPAIESPSTSDPVEVIEQASKPDCLDTAAPPPAAPDTLAMPTFRARLAVRTRLRAGWRAMRTATDEADAPNGAEIGPDAADKTPWLIDPEAPIAPAPEPDPESEPGPELTPIEHAWADALSERGAAYEDAWVFMDRLNAAHDNAEHLYRYVRAHHPEINAWFALQPDCVDWQRLVDDGFILVEHGSDEFQALMLRAAHLISSHLDADVVRPIDPAFYRGDKPWRFTYLKHGVSQNDQSAWYNIKSFDRVISATPAEFEALTGDGTPFRLTTKEVVLTGQPRLDTLRSARRKEDVASQRRRILIAPTWRRPLVTGLTDDPSDQAGIDALMRSEYVLRWSELLFSTKLHALARSEDLEIVFLPHPNMDPFLKSLELPSDVRTVSYFSDDVQQLILGAAVFITDYTGTAFDAAAANVPVVYYQFDAQSAFSGGHNIARGYFDYERDGFGPVTESLEPALGAITEILRNGLPPVYRDRTESTFAQHDGTVNARIVEAIRALDQRIEP